MKNGGDILSRKQWGHGYYQGREDALMGILNQDEWFTKTSLEMCVDEICRAIWIDRLRAEEGKCLFNVKRLFYEFGLTDRACRVIYEFIRDFNPYGFYVSGPHGDLNIEEDCICVPPYDETTVKQIEDRLEKYRKEKEQNKRRNFYLKWGIKDEIVKSD